MAVVWDEAMFRKWYSDTVRSPLPNQNTRVTYGRLYSRNWLWDTIDPVTGQPPDFPLNEYRLRADRLIVNFGIAEGSRVLILGSGFGFTCEALIQRNINSWGIDNSAFIHNNILTEAHPSMLNPTKVLNRDFRINDRQMKTALTNLTGGSTFDYVVTESVIESYTAAERETILSAAESYLTTGRSLRNVIHVVFPGWDASADGGSLGMTLDEWAATRPAHSWASPEGNWLVRVGS